MDWSLAYADSVVGLMFGLAKAIILALAIHFFVVLVAWNNDRATNVGRHLSVAVLALTLSVALAGVFVTYSIFRNQAQQNSEGALNDLGTDFVNWERDSPEIACLYSWHAFDDPAACRKAIFETPSSYRKTMLYIEEVIFFLKTAEKDRAAWGSRYADDVEFWAKDVSEDPTGMFAYNLVSENDDPREAAKQSGIEMSDEKLCGGFATVARELSRTDRANIPNQIATDPLAYCANKPAGEPEQPLA